MTSLTVAVGVPLISAGAGCNSQEAQQVAALILADILKFTINKALFALNEKLSGILELDNPEPEEKTGDVDLTLISSKGSTTDRGSAFYRVPPKTTNEYQWSGLRAGSADDYNVIGRSALNDISTSLFSIG